MAAYLIVRAEMTDMDAYEEYKKHTPGLIAKYGGEFIVRGGEVQSLQGEEETRRVVVVKFDSMEAARTFYFSEDYQEVLKIRLGASNSQDILVDGI